MAIGAIGAIILICSGSFIFYIFDPLNSTNDYIPNSFQINDITVESFSYLLQYDEFESREILLEELGELKYDLFILELFYDDIPLESQEINQIYSSQTEKILLCYVSIGEAESYRYYWDDSYDANLDGVPDNEAPEWLGIENPDWEGNYKVKYWLKEWQDIIFGKNESYIDIIISQGFDGVYMDIVDAFEYYKEEGIEDAAQKMVDFVLNISNYAKSINPDFLIVPQNGEALSDYEGYLNAVDGIGREDVLYNGNRKQRDEEIEFVNNYLSKFISAGKFVLEVEYPSIPRYINNCFEYAKEMGYICYVGPRNLATITISRGYEPQ